MIKLEWHQTSGNTLYVQLRTMLLAVFLDTNRWIIKSSGNTLMSGAELDPETAKLACEAAARRVLEEELGRLT